MHERSRGIGPEAADRTRRQAGVTLIELLVVMSIFTAMLAIVFTVLVTVTKQTKQNMSRVEDIQQARAALQQIDRQVRSGNIVIDPAAAGELPRSLRVYTQTDGVRRCVQWQVQDPQGVLRYRSWDPQWQSTPNSVDPWHVVARGVVSGSSAPTSFAKVGPAGSSQAQSVQVRLLVQSKASEGKPVEISTVLTGRNTIFGYPADQCAPVPPA